MINSTKSSLSFLLLLFTFSSCGLFVDDDDDEQIGIEVYEKVYSIDAEYIINPADPTDLKGIEVVYDQESELISNIVQVDHQDNNKILTIEYEENTSNYKVIRVVDEDLNILHQYTFNNSIDSIIINKDDQKYMSIKNATEGSKLPYRIQLFKENKTIFYYYNEYRYINNIHIYPQIIDEELATPPSIVNFNYLEYGNSVIYGNMNFSHLIILDHLEDFHLTKYLITDISRPTLSSNFYTNKDSTQIQYRNILNENRYPINISMINYDKDNAPRKQIIHIISYTPVRTPY
ncbi:hypothetical protein [Flammeovirga pacifica]|nr:hypothetical protein [Flammeovirga pacifica]